MLKHSNLSRMTCLFCASALLVACSKPEREKPDVPDEDTPQIVIDVQGNLNVPLEGGRVTIPYHIVNPVEGGILSASSSEKGWISDFTYQSDTAVVCNVSENTETESRSTVVTLEYIYSDDLDAVRSQINLIQEPAVDWDYDMKATDFRGHYYDTRYGQNGEYNYYTWLSDMPFDENGKTQAGGTYYLFDMYAGAPEDPLKPLPPAGTYTLGEKSSTAEMTFSSDYSSVRSTNDIGELILQEYFAEGSLEVVYENDSLKMKAELTDVAGALHRVVYEAPVPEYLFGDGGVGEEYLSIERDMNVVPSYAGASYFSEDGGVMEIYMTFSDMQQDAEGELVPPGSALKLEGVYMPVDEDGRIAAGEYRLTAEYGDAFTMYAGEMYELLGYLFPYGCYLEYTDEKGDLYYGFAVDGTMTVENRSEGGYNITCDFYTENGHRITCDYSGELEISGMPGPLSTLTGNYTLDFAETTASGYYYGDILGTGGGNWYLAISPADGLTGDGFITYLVSDGLDFSAGIASGTYKAAASSLIQPNEYQVGYMSGSGLGGTMYLGGYTEAGVTEYAPATSGDMNIVNHGDGSYTITFSFLDDRGFVWDGEWSGVINFSDVSYVPGAPALVPYRK